MGTQHIRGDLIAVRQAKTGTALLIPIHPDLAEALALLPKEHLTFVVTEFGAPFMAHGFGQWMREQCDLAGLPQCSAHGLRKAAATRLAEAGCSASEIQAITGHRSLSEVQRYVTTADQVRLARQAMAKQLGAKPEHSLSNLWPWLDEKEKNT